MASLNRLQDPSLQFLLWLEWILLAITALGELTRRFAVDGGQSSPFLSLICIGVLAFLGLHLPQQSRKEQWAYWILNFALVLLASLVGQVQFFFLLCVAVMIRSCLMFDRKGRRLTIFIMLAMFIGVQNYRIRTLIRPRLFARFQGDPILTVRPFLTGSVLLFALVLIFLYLLINALLSERTSREQLAKAHEQLRHYALQVEEVAILHERTRIAREIHDAIGHSLTALNLNLSAALGLWDQDGQEAKQLMIEAQDLSQQALKDVRQSVATLRASPWQEQTLEELIQGLVANLKRTDIQASCTLNLTEPLPEALSTAAYRVVQEALTNITKHAQATKVSIHLATEAKALTIVVQDNGRGFNVTKTSSGFGLRGMQERVVALGGTLEIKTDQGQGCQVLARLPFRSNSEAK